MSIFDKEITQKLQQQIRTIPNFPIEGIMFRDITPLLNSGEYLNMVTNMFVDICNHYGWTPDYIVGPEARGFIFGPLLAAKLGVGFIPIRKPGKLPSSTIQIEYSLEYGTNILEMHDDAISERLQSNHHRRSTCNRRHSRCVCKIMPATRRRSNRKFICHRT